MDLKWIAQELAVGSWKYLPNLPSKEPPTSTQPEFALQTAMKPIIMWRAGTEQVVTNKAGSVLIPPTPQQYEHDARGNLVSDGLWTRTWNLENRMMRIESASGVPAQVRKREDWKYLPDGRWIERIVSTNNGTAYYPALTNRYVWDDKVLLAILDHTNGLVMSFMRGSDLSGSIQGAGGVGGVLAVKVGSAVPSEPLRDSTHFVSYDGNGNVVGLTDAATGESSAVYEYGPFGEVLRATGPMAKQNPIRFSTRYTDDETDLVCYLHRYYNSSTGRWLSRDPVHELGFAALSRKRMNRGMVDASPYCFVGNSPISRIDLLGLSDKDVQTIISTFLSTMKTMCGDGRCCPEEGWRQNVYASWPWSDREGCTAQAVDLYGAMFPLTQGSLDDTWYVDAVQDTIIPPLFYHNYVTVTPLTPQPEGADGYSVGKISVDTWKGCYTITRKKMIFIEPNPQQSYWIWKDETKCFTCKELRKSGGK